MHLLVRAILVLTFVLQPVLLHARVLARCTRGPASTAAPVHVQPCCGMAATGTCCCTQTKASGCDCSTAPTQTPTLPERKASPVSELTTMASVHVGILSWATTAGFLPLAVLALVGQPPRISANSIQSFLCVWLT